VTILLVEERTLLLGDACNFFTFLFDEFSLGITSYENMLKELDEKTAGRYGICHTEMAMHQRK